MNKKQTLYHNKVKNDYKLVFEACTKPMITEFMNATKDFDWNAPAKKGPVYENWNWEIINACAPFALLKGAHRGYAETENINDINECYNLLKEAFSMLNEPDVSGKRLYIPAATVKQQIKQQNERFAKNNGIYIARLLGRLVYLYQTELVKS